MARERELKVTILGDSSGAQRAFAQVGQAGDGIGSKMGALGKLLGAAFIGAGAGVAAFGVKAVSAASDLNETISKVGVVFGEQSKQVTSFANQMARDFGLPKREILDAAAGIGLVGKASGLSQEAAGKMSVQLAKIAADASSFYNVPLPEALDAIKSGLVGEAEPLRRFGVLLSADALATEAVALGIAKAGEELTEQQKVQARSSLIIKGMTDASGDLERTQDSLSNRMRELRGRAENFAATVGTALIPVVLKAFDVFEGLQKTLGPPLQRAFRTISLGVKALGAAFSEGDVTSDGFVGVMERIGVAARSLFDAVGPAFTKIRDVVVSVLENVRGGLSENEGTFNKWRTKLSDIFAQISEVVGTAFEAIKVIITIAVSTLSNLWDRFGEHLWSHIKVALDAVLQVLSGVFKVIQGVLDVFIGIFTGDWSRAWDGIKSIFSGVWDVIVGLLRAALNTVSTIIGAGMAIISEIWHRVWSGLSDAAGTALAFVVDKILGAFEWIVKGAAGAFGWVPGIGGKLKEAAKDFEQFRDDVNRALGGINDKIVQVKIAQKDTGNYAMLGRPQANGGIVSFANGAENHVAQIARAGEWRVWAEPETGGEAYIPLAPSKRSRSKAILNDVAGRFGMRSFANGGVDGATGAGILVDLRGATIVGPGGIEGVRQALAHALEINGNYSLSFK